jgi:hypothetical protein
MKPSVIAMQPPFTHAAVVDRPWMRRIMMEEGVATADICRIPLA